MSSAQQEIAAALYKQGLDLRAIGRAMKLSHERVRQILKSARVRIRPPGRRRVP